MTYFSLLIGYKNRESSSINRYISSYSILSNILYCLRYEWTAGYADKDEPEGIFDNLNDDVWHYAGQTNQAILNIKRGNFMKFTFVQNSKCINSSHKS